MWWTHNCVVLKRQRCWMARVEINEREKGKRIRKHNNYLAFHWNASTVLCESLNNARRDATSAMVKDAIFLLQLSSISMEDLFFLHTGATHESLRLILTPMGKCDELGARVSTYFVGLKCISIELAHAQFQAISINCGDKVYWNACRLLLHATARCY